MSLSKYTSYGTMALLGTTGIAKLFSGERGKTENLETIRRLELLILGIATGQYAIAINMPFERLQRWRYVDWIVTTPLLLKTFHLLAVEKGFDGPLAPAITANILMIVSGYIADFPQNFTQSKNKKQLRRVSWAIGMASLIIIFYYIKKWDDYLKEKGVDTGRLPYFFYLGWTVYGANFLNPDAELRQTTFNILDFINKGLYSLELSKVIRENF